MSVYVDTPIRYASEVRGYVGRRRDDVRWGHMIADSEAELHAMAVLIGLRREWHQGNHYDLVPSKRAEALRRGAIACTRREFVEHLRRLRATIPSTKSPPTEEE